MTLRLSSSAARAFLVLFALILTVSMAYSGVRNALAAHFASLDTLDGSQRAAQLSPKNSENWYRLGRYWQYNLDDPQPQKAIAAYQTSLSLNPHSADAWSDLAMAYELEDNIAAARNAFLQAKHAYPFSSDVSWSYGNFLLRRGETDAALDELRKAVLVDPKRAAAAYALCRRIRPDLASALDRVVPPSQAGYLNVVSSLAEQGQTAAALLVWSRLMNLHPRISLLDGGPLVEALLRKYQMPEAQRVWTDTVASADITPPPGPPGSLVWDGGFETDVVNVGLAWRYSPVLNGVQISRDSNEKYSGNHSLRLTFNGLQNVDLHDLCQIVLVQPSAAYRFSAWIRTRALSTDEGLRFVLRSLGPSGGSVSWTDSVTGTQAWSQIVFPWTAAGDANGLQLCISRRPSAKFDSKIRGTAWVDDVALVPRSAEALGQ